MSLVTRTFEIQIQAAPEAVYAYVSDLTRHPEWSGGNLKIEPATPGPAAVGQRYRSLGDVGGQKDRPNELRLSILEPPVRFGFVANDPDFGDVTHEFTITPEAGGARLQRTIRMTLPAVRAIIFGAVIFPFVGRPMMDKSMQALKARLEGQAGRSGP